MSSIHRSQLRLKQITGSLPASNVTAAPTPDLASLKDILDHVASGIHNISGQDFHNIADSTLKDSNNQSRISYATGAGVIIGAEGDGSSALTIGSSTSGDKTVAAAADLTVAGNATISGNLTVSGQTTAIDTVNLSVEDKLIELNKGVTHNTTDVGFIFSRAAAQGSSVVIGLTNNLTTAVPTSEVGKGVKIGDNKSSPAFKEYILVSKASLSTGDVIANGDAIDDGSAVSTMAAGSIAVKINPTVTTFSQMLEELAIAINGAQTADLAAKASVVAGELKLEEKAASVRTGAGYFSSLTQGTVIANFPGSDIAFSGGSSQESAGNLALYLDESEGANTNLLLRASVTENAANSLGDIAISDGKKVLFGSDGFVISGSNGGTDSRLMHDTDSKLKLAAKDAYSMEFAVKFEGLKSFDFKNADDQDAASVATLSLFDQQNSNAVSIDVPASVIASYTLTLPPEAGNGALIADANQNLSFQQVPTIANMKKISYLVTGSHDAGLSYDLSDMPSNGTTLDLGPENPDVVKLVDVYVNGQLLMSGSNTEVDDGNADYRIAAFGGSGNDADLAFSFDLEADDVVTVIRRG